MSTIKPIEGRSVHQIQSGQVIVDLCSVVKELVENSLDAGATSIDVRFKNQGLDSIEVQDNGAGILPEDYETIALKHYTSKLSSYDDLSSLDTFGFRGEALSSLCALSHFHIITARDTEAPKGKRLDFETSGKLKGTTVTACQKGTTVAVETLFYNLPVRRRELEKNIKREYGKVLGILHAYACISVGVRLSVSNQMAKGKKLVVFSTSSNPNTRQNISNVFGAKTLLALIPMSLDLELEPSVKPLHKVHGAQQDDESRKVHLEGHISRPIFGEGRQTPDRQMFFVNSRPCGLPQVAKAFNEVYKSYNITQSPFIFANLKMNSNAYDVNVSPDKRTILLHDQTALLETLKESLNKLFEAQDQTVPQSTLPANQLPSFRPLVVDRDSGIIPASDQESEQIVSSSNMSSDDGPRQDLVHKFAARNSKDRDELYKQKASSKLSTIEDANASDDRSPQQESEHTRGESNTAYPTEFRRPRIVDDFNDRLASQQEKSRTSGNAREESDTPLAIPTISVGSANQPPGLLQSAFDKMRPKRMTPDSATTTVASYTGSATIGTPEVKRRKIDSLHDADQTPRLQVSRFAKRMHVYAAPGTKSGDEAQNSNEESGDEEEHSPESEASSKAFDPGARSQQSEQGDSVQSDAEDDETGLVETLEDESDGDFIDEAERKKRDEAKVEEMVRRAEEAAAKPTQGQKKRAKNLLNSSVHHAESTLSLLTFVDTSAEKIGGQLSGLNSALESFADQPHPSENPKSADQSQVSAEERLALTIAKTDFARMRIIGQFNLGFILATRPGGSNNNVNGNNAPSDDLFIIDQHASDEIYNFSRLSLTTTLNPQPLVRPHLLELTAIEEETILNHTDALARNGFTISVDESGDSPVGRRCHLLTLPTSRETVFDPRDLEELIALLGDTTPAARGEVVRPSRVRKMLAMRACRSSIMVGKPLTKRGMGTVVRHMGEIDRPWNCPHGRPTMRHLAGLGDWAGWEEGDGLVDDDVGAAGRDETDWWTYLDRARGSGMVVGRAEEADVDDVAESQSVEGEDGHENDNGNDAGDDGHDEAEDGRGTESADD